MNVINDVIKRRGLSQKDRGQTNGTRPGRRFRIEHGRGSRYSTDRLLNVLARLGTDVEITQRRGEAGELLIEVRELSHV